MENKEISFSQQLNFCIYCLFHYNGSISEGKSAGGVQASLKTKTYSY